MPKIIKSANVDASTVREFQRDPLEELVIQAGIGEVGKGEGALPDPAGILAAARAQAEEQIRQAHEEGLKQGIEAGRAAFLESVGQSAEALERAGEAMRQSREEFLASLEPQVVRLAGMIAERVIRREARIDPLLVTRMARAALSELTGRERVTVRMNPDDCDALQKQDISLLEEFEGVKQLEVVADATIQSGGCVVETEAVQVDAQLDAMLERLLDDLME